MAAAATVMSENLNCAICLQRLDDPKQLVCGHTFCKKCLAQVHRSHSQGKIITCPICRQNTSIPNKDVSKLPTNIALKSIIEDLNVTTQICTANCHVDKSPAVKYCQNCSEFMCASCDESHGKWRKNADHVVVNTDDIQAGKISIKVKCKIHPEEFLTYVCTDCKRSLCFRCRVLECDKELHDVVDDTEYARNKRKNIEQLQHRTETKVRGKIQYVEVVNKQKDLVKKAVNECRGEINMTYDNYIQELTKKKGDLLAACDREEASLLTELEELSRKQSNSISSISSACELVANSIKSSTASSDSIAAHNTMCGELECLLDAYEPDSSEATALSNRGQMLQFAASMENQNIVELGQVQFVEWEPLSDRALSRTDCMTCMAVTQEGLVAVGSSSGGIDIFCADDYTTVLKDVAISGMGFLYNNRCVVRDYDNNISLYTSITTECKKMGVRFETLSTDKGVFGGLTVCSNDQIYVGYRKAKKIQVFTPAGGKAVREIPFAVGDGCQLWQIFAMKSSKLLMVTGVTNSVSVIDQSGAVKHKVVKDGDISSYPCVCQNGSILIAWVEHEEGLVSIDQYTSELRHIRTLITDHKIKKPGRKWYYLQECLNAEIYFCTPDRYYVFHKSVTPVTSVTYRKQRTQMNMLNECQTM